VIVLTSIVIHDTHIVFPWGILDGDVLIENGRVKAIGRSLERAGEKINGYGKLVLPGVVDVHVHMREPGLEYKDDFRNGTRDAVSNGVTTVLEMPNTLPPVDNAHRLMEKKKLLESKAYCDFALYGVIHDHNIDKFEEMVEAGAIGFKIFLGPTTGEIPPPPLNILYMALKKSGEHGVPIAFHAEEWELVKYFIDVSKSSGRDDPLVHVDSRPPICEELAIMKIALIAKHTNADIHIVHISSCEALDALRYAKKIGVNVTGETNPHYLLLDTSDYEKHGSLIKVNPPIRGGVHRECLWKGVLDNSIDIIASDHAPHSIEEKNRNIWEASSGIPGVSNLLPLMLHQALINKISLTKLVQLLSFNPAKKFKLYPSKGCLNPGCDADIVLIDPGGETVIDREKMYCKNKINPFHGWRLRGRIEKVLLRGEIIYDNGVLREEPYGRFIKPARGV